SLALSDLAELVLEEACHVCVTELHVEYGTPRMSNERPSRFAICGLGKFGGREMGYASDIEVLFVYDGTGVTDGRTSLETSEYFECSCMSSKRSRKAFFIWMFDCGRTGERAPWRAPSMKWPGTTPGQARRPRSSAKPSLSCAGSQVI